MRSMATNVIDAIRHLFSEESKSLLRLVDRLDSGNYLEAVRLLQETEELIVVSGVGTSGILGRKLAASLSSIGAPSLFIHPADALHGNLGQIANGAVIILISHSGGTAELVRLLEASKELGLLPILITSRTDSVLAGLSRVVLPTWANNEADPLGLVPTNSAVSTLAVGDALMSGLACALETSETMFYRNHPAGSLGKSLSLRFRDVMKTELIASCCIGINSTLSDAIFAMSAGRIGACFIVDNGFLKGLFTDGDLRRFMGSVESLDLEQNLLEIATQNFTTVSEEELVIPFLKRMELQQKKFSVFPVVDEHQQLKGVADLHQILALEL